MSIREDCRDFMTEQLGHAISDNKLDDIEARVSRNMRQLGREDPEAWQQLPYHERVQQGAAAAAKEMAEEFKQQQFRLQKQIEAHQRIESVLASAPDRKAGDKLKAVSRLDDFDPRRAEYTSAHSWAQAIQKETWSELMPLWKAMPGNFFGLFENKAGHDALWKELHHEDSGNSTAKAGAAAWHKVMEEKRQRMNDAGGNIGKLQNYDMPHHNSQSRVAAAKIDKWTADTLPELDRAHYINPDGSRMSNDQMHEFLGHAFDSIITDGQQDKNEAGKNVAGHGIIADRGSAHRALFFKDSDSHARYNAKYGEKSLPNLLLGHIRGISRDIALTERMGPNAERTHDFFNDRALLDELREFPEKEAYLRSQHKYNQALFDKVAGKEEVVDSRVSRIGQAFRNWQTGVKLPKVVITALGDESGMAATAYANRIPYGAMLRNELRTLNPADSTARAAMQHASFGLETTLGHFNRWGQEEFNSSFTAKLASTVMHLSGAERMWAARRAGTAATLMSSMGSLTRKIDHIDKLTQADHGVIAQKGITDKTWQVWRRAEVEDQGPDRRTILTPKAVWAIPDEKLKDLGNPRALKREAVTQLLAHAHEEAGMGAMDTGPRQQVRVNLGSQKGSYGGEAWRAFNLFRGYSFSMMMKHWGRAANQPGVYGKLRYMAPLAVYGTLIAAAGNQIRNVISGQDPDSMKDWRFWGKAILRGGGMGFFGDFLYNEATQNDNSLAAGLGGPAMTSLEDIWNITGKAAFKKAKGEKTDEGANVVKFLRNNTPIQGMWYTQAAFDHMLWNHMQEAASPGYLSRMQSRAATYGKQYYWRPQDTTPSRPPDMKRAIERPSR